MEKLLLALLFLHLPTSPAYQTYKQYCNARFSFCVEYPANFKAQAPPANGDGLSWLSEDKKTKIRAYAGLAIEGFEQLNQEFTAATKHIKLSYKTIKKDWFIFSGLNSNNKIVYRKTRKTSINYLGQPATPVFQTLMIEYPAGQAKLYKSYCQQIANSLQ